MCPEHPDEPLLDLADPEVRLLFEGNEARERRTRGHMVGGIVGTVTYVLALLVADMVGMVGELAMLAVFGLAYVAGSNAAAITSKALPAARRLQLDQDELLALEAARGRDLEQAPSTAAIHERSRSYAAPVAQRTAA